MNRSTLTPHTLDQEIRRVLACYLMGDISLAEFSRRFAPLAWQAEELAAEDPDVANYAAQIDLRLVEYADRYWTEDQLRGLLGPLIMATGHSESSTVVHDAEIGTQTF